MKNTLKAAALTLAMASPLASAQDVPVSIFMDLNSIINGTSDVNDVNYDAGLVTDVFQLFSTVAFNPVSTYTDTNGVAGINTGDLVHDEGTGISILGLNPLTHSSQEGGFGNAWGLEISWSLDGVAGVFEDANWGDSGVEQYNYLGNFFSGSFSMDIVELDVNNGDVLNTFSGLDMAYSHMSFSPVNPTQVSDNEAVVNFYADVVSAIDDTFFFAGTGEDFADTLADDRAINIKVKGDLKDLGQEPQQVGNSDVYTRSTSLDSFDVNVVPEPTSVAIMGLGLLGLGLSRRRKQK